MLVISLSSHKATQSKELPVTLAFRSLIFVCLILFLISSFWRLRCSGFPHQIGRLYSHWTRRLLQALQEGCFSSHFFRRRRHVKQPVGQHRAFEQTQLFSDLPERDLLCNLFCLSVLSMGVEGIFGGGDSDSIFLVTLGLGVDFFFVAGIVYGSESLRVQRITN